MLNGVYPHVRWACGKRERTEVSLMRGMWTRARSDDAGMTLIEVVIAAAILFIVLTGVLGLVGQTTLVSQQSKEITVANNAVNAYIEWVRSLDFEAIELAGETTAGILESVHTTSTGEYTITIEPTVADGINAALKELTMQITVSRADGVRESYHTTVIIRDKDQFLSQVNQDPAYAPKVSWTTPTPPGGSIVFDQHYMDSAKVVHLLNLGITATAAADRTIEQVTVWCDDTYVLENLSAQRAEWILSTPAQNWSLSPYFNWNSRQQQTYTDEYGVEYTVPVIKDGKRSLIVYARDNQGDVSYQTRQVFVDNYAPSTPEAPTAAIITATRADIDWPVASDGTELADRYHVRLYRQNPTGSADYWSEATFPTGKSPYMTTDSYAFDWAAPMSRYYARVRALSPRPLYSAYANSTTAFITRPQITGTYSVVKSSGKYTTSVALNASPPTFSISTTDTIVVYDWNWRYVASGATGHQYKFNDPTFTKVVGPVVGAPYIMEFWCVIRAHVAGPADQWWTFGGGHREYRTSNLVVTGSVEGSGTPFAVGTWPAEQKYTW